MTDLRSEALDLLDTADMALVTTLDLEGRPNTRAMFNLRNRRAFPDLAARFDPGTFTTVFTTNTSSSKLAELARDPEVSVYYCLPDQFRGLMLGGRMEAVTDPELRRSIWQPGWTLYYPGGWQDPDHTVLRLIPDRIKYYHQLRHARFANEAP